MPALGLPDAEQKITADASGYLAALDAIDRKNLDLLDRLRDIGGGLKDLQRQLDDFERNLPDLEINMMIDEHFNDAVKGAQDNIDQLAAKALKANSDMQEAWEQHTDVVKDFGTQIDRVSTVVSDFSDHADRMGTSVDRITASVGDLHATSGRISSEGSVASVASDLMNVQSAADDAAVSIASVHREGSRLLNILGGAGGLAAALAGGLAGGAITHPGGAGGMAMGLGAIAATGLAARAAGGGGGDGGFGVGAALAAAAGGAGGFIGNVGGAIGGMSASGPTAADTSRVVTGFLRRWYPAAHWAMMLTNELLATAGPAVVAGGMGAMTGAQGFEQLIPRGQAVFNTSEALGGSLGMTTGKAWGLKTSYLQNAQNLANGMATEMAGAFVNMLNAPGAGTAFTQLGLNTDSMFSRFLANMTMEFQKGGLGGKLGNLVTGGTGYLQQFGDTFGNLGKTFLNVAPNLPGVGGDLLGILSGGTGALAKTTGWLGGMLGPILAGEAGMRWGPAIVGTAGRSVTGLGNLLGNIGKGGVLSDIGLGTGTEGGLAGVGAAIGGLSAPEIGGIAAAALLLGKGITYKTPAQMQANQMQTLVGQQGFVAGMPMILSDMQKLAGVSPTDNAGTGFLGNLGQGIGGIAGGISHLRMSELWHGLVQGTHGSFQMVQALGGGHPSDPGNYTVAQAALKQLSETMVNSLGSGRQVQALWQGLSHSSIDMGKAFDVATMAQLQLGSAFEKNGVLTQQAKTMISNLYAGYAPMNMNTGMFGAAVGAQTAMSGLQHTQISAVNSAYDSLSQLVTGGAAGASSYFGLLGGTPTTVRRGGLQLAAPPAFKAMANALTSFTTPAGAGAWNTLTNQQTGLMPALEGQLDWLREAQTMGALGPGQTTGMAAFEMAQMLPMLKKSPAGLAMLSMYAQQYGGPGFAPGTSAKSMFSGLSKWISGVGTDSKGFNAGMTQGTEGMANIGRDAQQFVQQIGSGIGGAMAQGIASHGAQLQDAFMNVVGHRGTAAALSKYDQFLFGSGVPLKGAQDMVSYAAKLSGASPQQINAMMAQVKKEYDIYVKVHADTSPIAQFKALLAGIHDKTVTVMSIVNSHPVIALGAALSGLTNKTVTVTTNVVTNYINTVHTQLGVPTSVAAGVSPGFLLSHGKAGGLVMHGGIAKYQTGGIVPGSGFGDIVPAMLEPGEVVIPRSLVPLIAPFLQAHRIPGFGMPQSSSSHFAAGGIVPAGGSLAQINDQIKNVWLTLDKLYSERDSGNKSVASQIASIWKTQLDPLYAARDHLTGHKGASVPTAGTTAAARNFAITLTGEIAKEVKNSNAAKTIAQALVNKIGQEVQYAKSVASGVQSGLNLAGMDLTQGSVLQQMQGYAASSAMFGTDLTALRKGHLNKDLISQIVAAGPVQGDLLAQSILGSGIGGINKTWSQIVGSSKVIGSQAAMAQYGGFLAPNLKSGTFSSNNVTINISASGGTTLALTNAQIAQLVAKIQAALLKQGRRNQKTGVQLAGKGA